MSMSVFRVTSTVTRNCYLLYPRAWEGVLSSSSGCFSSPLIRVAVQSHQGAQRNADIEMPEQFTRLACFWPNLAAFGLPWLSMPNRTTDGVVAAAGCFAFVVMMSSWNQRGPAIDNPRVAEIAARLCRSAGFMRPVARSCPRSKPRPSCSRSFAATSTTSS